MRRVIATEQGGALYSQRQWMVEPVFAQIKTNRRIDRFKRRGLAAARSEWRLIAATHNLLKLHRHTLQDRRGLRQAPAQPDPVPRDRAAAIRQALRDSLPWKQQREATTSRPKSRAVGSRETRETRGRFSGARQRWPGGHPAAALKSAWTTPFPLKVASP